MSQQEPQLELLRSVEFLADLPETLLARLAQHFQPISFAKDEEIITAKEVGDCMFFILAGSVRVHQDYENLAILKEGQFFGEFSLIDSEPRSASVSALEAVDLYQLSRAAFFQVLVHEPKLFEGILRLLVGRMRDMLEQREEKLQVLVEHRTVELSLANEELSRANQEILLRKEEITMRKSELEGAYEELKATNEQLNDKSLELNRQKQLIELKNAELNEKVETISRQQEHMIQSEKMAALGMLAPVVAHEINTPTGAIKGTVQNLEHIIPILFEALRLCLLITEPEKQAELYQLVDQLTRQAEPLSTREERQRVREIEQLFENANFADGEEFATKLVKAGVVNNLEQLLPWLKEPAKGRAVLELAYEMGRTRKQLMTIDQSADRVSRIVTSLTNYVHRRPESSKPTPTDLASNIDIVLTLYEYYFRQGVELIRTYPEDVPLIDAFPENLIQVWTNILMNALHAVKTNLPDKPPRIEIIIDFKPEWAEVHITNNGPPIPEAVIEKVFEPLFTTKPKEEGTGLGLSISVKIVEQHGGRISVESDDNLTDFLIRLPRMLG